MNYGAYSINKSKKQCQRDACLFFLAVVVQRLPMRNLFWEHFVFTVVRRINKSSKYARCCFSFNFNFNSIATLLCSLRLFGKFNSKTLAFICILLQIVFTWMSRYFGDCSDVYVSAIRCQCRKYAFFSLCTRFSPYSSITGGNCTTKLCSSEFLAHLSHEN